GSAMATSASSRAWARLRRSSLSWLCVAALATLAVAGIFGPLLIGGGPDTISAGIFAPPSPGPWLGTPGLGRAVVSLLLYGVRTSLVIGLLAAISATLIGIAVGAIAGFAGGRAETVLMRITEIFQVMPTFVLAAVIVAMAGPGVLRVIFVIAILSWP